MALCAMTERCDRSALCEKLVEIAAAPTPLRHGFAMPPPLKGRLWVDQEIYPYKVHSNASISFHRGCLWFVHNILYLSL